MSAKNRKQGILYCILLCKELFSNSRHAHHNLLNHKTTECNTSLNAGSIARLVSTTTCLSTDVHILVGVSHMNCVRRGTIGSIVACLAAFGKVYMIIIITIYFIMINIMIIIITIIINGCTCVLGQS